MRTEKEIREALSQAETYLNGIHADIEANNLYPSQFEEVIDNIETRINTLKYVLGERNEI